MKLKHAENKTRVTPPSRRGADFKCYTLLATGQLLYGLQIQAIAHLRFLLLFGPIKELN